MRRIVIYLALALAIGAQGALAQIGLLSQPVEMTSARGGRGEVVNLLPQGTYVEIVAKGRDFTFISYDRQRGYVPTAAVTPLPANYYGAQNIDCDYGYPYSGSARAFDFPLTQLRHSGPLGFFLGWHERRPC